MQETKRADFISKWNNANQDEKDEYLLKAKYINQQKNNSDKIFLQNVVLEEYDNTLNKTKTHFNIIGPMQYFEEFSEKERIILENRGINVPFYKTIGDYTFNWKAFKKWNVTVYGGNENDKSTWWYVLKNYKGNVGNFVFTKNQEKLSSENYC